MSPRHTHDDDSMACGPQLPQGAERRDARLPANAAAGAFSSGCEESHAEETNSHVWEAEEGVSRAIAGLGRGSPTSGRSDKDDLHQNDAAPEKPRNLSESRKRSLVAFNTEKQQSRGVNRTPTFAVQADDQEMRSDPPRFIRSPAGRHGAFLEDGTFRHRPNTRDERDSKADADDEMAAEESRLSSEEEREPALDAEGMQGFTATSEGEEMEVTSPREDEHPASDDDGASEDEGDAEGVTVLGGEFSTIPIGALFDIHVAEFCRGYRHAGAFSYDNFKKAVAQSYRVRMSLQDSPNSPAFPLDGLSSSSTASKQGVGAAHLRARDRLCIPGDCVKGDGRPAISRDSETATVSKADDIPGLRALQASLEDYESCRQWVFRFCTFLRLHEELAYISVYLMHFLLMRWNSWQPPPRLILPEYRTTQGQPGGGSKKGELPHKVASSSSSSSSTSSPMLTPEVEDAQTRSILWGVSHVQMPSDSLRYADILQQKQRNTSGTLQGSHRTASAVPSKPNEGLWRTVHPSPSACSRHPLPPLARLACVCIAIAYKQLEVVPHLDCAGIVVEAVAFAKEEDSPFAPGASTPPSATGAGADASTVPLNTRNAGPRPFWAVNSHHEESEALFKSPSCSSDHPTTRPSFLSHSPGAGCCECCRVLNEGDLNGEDSKTALRKPALYCGSERIVFQLKHSRTTPATVKREARCRVVSSLTPPRSITGPTPAWPPTGWLELYAWSCIEEEGLLTHANVFLFLQWLLGASKLHRRKYGARWLPSRTPGSQAARAGARSYDTTLLQTPETKRTDFSKPTDGLGMENPKKGNLPASRSTLSRFAHTESVGTAGKSGPGPSKGGSLWWGGGHQETELADKKQLEERQAREESTDRVGTTGLHKKAAREEILLPLCPPSALPLYILQVALCSRDPCFLNVPPPIQAACVLRLLLTCFECETKHVRFLDAVLGPEFAPEVKAATGQMVRALLAAARSTSPLWAWRLPAEVVHGLFSESLGKGLQCARCRLQDLESHASGEVTSGGMHGQRAERAEALGRKEKLAPLSKGPGSTSGRTGLVGEEWDEVETPPNAAKHGGNRCYPFDSDGHEKKRSHPATPTTPIRRRRDEASPGRTITISPHQTWSIAATLCPHGSSRWDFECSRCCVSPSSSIRKHFSRASGSRLKEDSEHSGSVSSQERDGRGSRGGPAGAQEAGRGRNQCTAPNEAPQQNGGTRQRKRGRRWDVTKEEILTIGKTEGRRTHDETIAGNGQEGRTRSRGWG